jgi:hypothetical protein
VTLREAIRGLAAFGYNCTLRHIRDVVVVLPQSLRDDDAAVSTIEGPRWAESQATEWTAGSRSPSLCIRFFAGIAQILDSPA